MNRKQLKAKKGTSLIVVFIVCTVITILLSTTFLVVANYGVTVVSRREQLRKIVCATCEVEDKEKQETETSTEGTDSEETSSEETSAEETSSEETTPEAPEEGSEE